jgi:hypothetical protein
MKNKFVLLGAAAFLSLAYAAEEAQWPAPYRPFKGVYTIYSGGLDDQQAPTKDDRRLSFIIEGAAAKEIFNAMPPDAKTSAVRRKVHAVAAKKKSGVRSPRVMGIPAILGLTYARARALLAVFVSWAKLGAGNIPRPNERIVIGAAKPIKKPARRLAFLQAITTSIKRQYSPPAAHWSQ